MKSTTKRFKKKKEEEPKRNFGAEEYNDWIEASNWELQQQTWASRRISELDDKLIEII